MAPEQKDGATATPAADLYAVGLVLASSVAAPLPSAVQAVVERALARDPRERWASAAEMRAALARSAAALTPGT